MSPLLWWLGIVRGHKERVEYELMRGKLRRAYAALEELDRMSHVDFINSVVLASLRREYEENIERGSAAMNELYFWRQQLNAEELQRHLLLVEKGVAIDACHRGFVSQAAQEKLLADIDALLLGLESGKTDGSAEHGGEGSGANC